MQWDPVLSLQWLGPLLQHGFDSGLGTSICCGHGQKKKKKKAVVVIFNEGISDNPYL